MQLISMCVLPPSLGNLRAPVYCLPESLQLHLPPSFPGLPGFVSLLCIKSRCFSSGSSQRCMIPSIAPPAQTLPHQIILKSFEIGSLNIPFITYITIYTCCYFYLYNNIYVQPSTIQRALGFLVKKNHDPGF